MLILLALPIIVAVAAMHRYLHYAPTNLLARRVRGQEPRLRTAAALIVFASVLLIAMHALGEAVANGAPGWLHLMVVVLAWDAIKMGFLAALIMIRWLSLGVRVPGTHGGGTPHQRRLVVGRPSECLTTAA